MNAIEVTSDVCREFQRFARDYRTPSAALRDLLEMKQQLTQAQKDADANQQ